MTRTATVSANKRSAVLGVACGLVLMVSGLGSYWNRPEGSIGEPPRRLAIQVTFGLGDSEPSNWDGMLKLSAGRVMGATGLRFEGGDRFEDNEWKIQTRHQRPAGQAQQELGRQNLPMDINGFVLTLADLPVDGVVQIKTPRGEIAVRPHELELGVPARYLERSVEIERLPASEAVVTEPTEDDYPSAAVAPDGTVRIAYVSFTHGAGWASTPQISELPNDWSLFDRPTGGDQVWLVEGKPGEWQRPVAVTAGGLDVWQPAVAVDSTGAAWVFWSEQTGGNWDILARRRSEGRWEPAIKLSDDPGSDFGVTAATAADGTVWVAWQGFRSGQSDIFSTHLEGERFAPATRVSSSALNDWNPCLAASPRGEVTIAWDTYERGSYDVHCRTWKNKAWGDERPVAATARFEARSSAAYDASGRLWVAWEEAGEGWGKDWGALDQQYVPLYRGRTVRLAVANGDGWSQPAGDLEATLDSASRPASRQAASGDGGAARKAKAKKKQAQGTDQAKAKRKQAGEAQGAAPVASSPKLARDAAGHIWLTTRVRMGNYRSPVGSVWYEHACYHDGTAWSPTVRVPDSDNLLASRCAWAPLPSGEMLLTAAGDHRGSVQPGGGRRKQAGEPRERDAVNSDIFTALLGPAKSNAKASDLAGPKPAEVSPAPPYALAERDHVRAIRDYRAKIDGQELRILRGEFHRHTEISADGGNDGSIMDMWRYALDAASMDWLGCGDHDNGGGREYSWWITQKTADLVTAAPTFLPMYSYERSVSYPDGHRNVMFAKRGVRTLPRLQGGLGKSLDDQPDAPRPSTPDVEMLYAYLKQFGGICASHTSGTNMGTDWRNNDSVVEPVVEIYQGCRQSYELPDSPRSNREDYSIGGWRPLGFVSLALAKGYRLGFQSSSDHGSTHISYASIYVTEPTRQAIIDAIRRRHAYAATDNIIADVRSGSHFMGDEFKTDRPPQLEVKAIGTGPIARVVILRDSQPVHTVEPGAAKAAFHWVDPKPVSGTHYYYVRVEQTDGELAWISPMWITYEPKP